MPVSLLTLPYELREQILTSILCQGGSIKFHRNTQCKADFTPPISQVCRLLRDEATRLFLRVNTFTLTIDTEEVSLDIALFSYTHMFHLLTFTALDRTHQVRLLPSCQR
jgi:hypothetical protein